MNIRPKGKGISFYKSNIQYTNVNGVKYATGLEKVPLKKVSSVQELRKELNRGNTSNKGISITKA